ncbi:MAG: YqaJ viral recombinase family protein [Rickettsiales bacterium]|jgi:putative phage-type endonuclease|nr:YqaJ viral recombinase family protein [Rickettsiales bacterium]
MKIYDDIDQRTEEWHKLRAGKFTGSDFHILFGNSETKNNLLLKKTAERLRKTTIEDTYINQDMERGIELEKQARLLYEIETNQIVKEVGFCELDEWVGCSPDGLIEEEIETTNTIPTGGIIEIKCPKDIVFLNQVINDKIKPEYYTQIQFNLYVTDRQYCDYIAYNINYPLFIKKIERDEEYIQKIKDTIEDCKKKVENNIIKIMEVLKLQ